MKYNFIWDSTNTKEQKEYIENKIKEWSIEDVNLCKNQALTIKLSMKDPLDNILNGIIENETQNIIYKFRSNEFLDNMLITTNN